MGLLPVLLGKQELRPDRLIEVRSGRNAVAGLAALDPRRCELGAAGHYFSRKTFDFRVPAGVALLAGHFTTIIRLVWENPESVDRR